MFDTRENILIAARRSFVEKGYQRTPMRDIANEVGITAAALYKHYPNKEAIFDAVVSPAVAKWEQFCLSEPSRQAEVAGIEGLDSMWDDKVRMESPEIFRVLGKRRPEFVIPYIELLRKISETDGNRVVRIHILGAIKATKNAPNL